jgi:hypothetical protein
MSKKNQSTFEKWWGASLRQVLRFKWNQWKTDTRKPLLSMIEIILAAGIAAAMAVYLDPDWNVVPFPYNVLAFIILVGAAILVHRRTRPYRMTQKLAKSSKQ